MVRWTYGVLRPRKDFRVYGCLYYPADEVPPISLIYWAMAIKRWVLRKVVRKYGVRYATLEELDRAFNSYPVRCKLCGEQMIYFIDGIYGFESEDSFTPTGLYLICDNCGYYIEIEDWGL